MIDGPHDTDPRLLLWCRSCRRYISNEDRPGHATHLTQREYAARTLQRRLARHRTAA